MISILLVFLCGIFDAVMDVSMFHYSTSIFKNLNPSFWSEQKSAQVNKNNFLGFRNDAWHFSKLLKTILYSLAIVSFKLIKFNHGYEIDIISNFGLLYLSWSLSFIIFYNYILIKK